METILCMVFFDSTGLVTEPTEVPKALETLLYFLSKTTDTNVQKTSQHS